MARGAKMKIPSTGRHPCVCSSAPWRIRHYWLSRWRWWWWWRNCHEVRILRGILLRRLLGWCVIPLVLIKQDHKAVWALVLWTMIGRSIGDFNRMRGRTTCWFSRILVFFHGIFRKVVLWTKRNKSRRFLYVVSRIELTSEVRGRIPKSTVRHRAL
ncbi:hypothetical protein Hanom_Chr01g00064231 [Helianthus anomalus]